MLIHTTPIFNFYPEDAATNYTFASLFFFFVINFGLGKARRGSLQFPAPSSQGLYCSGPQAQFSAYQISGPL
jgi:hypothetical protein